MRHTEVIGYQVQLDYLRVPATTAAPLEEVVEPPMEDVVRCWRGCPCKHACEGNQHDIY